MLIATRPQKNRLLSAVLLGLFGCAPVAPIVVAQEELAPPATNSYIYESGMGCCPNGCLFPLTVEVCAPTPEKADDMVKKAFAGHLIKRSETAWRQPYCAGQVVQVYDRDTCQTENLSSLTALHRRLTRNCPPKE
jgi:hypothetical protein